MHPRQTDSGPAPQARRARTQAGTARLVRPPRGIRTVTRSHAGTARAKPPGFHGTSLQGGGEQSLGPHSARWLDELVLQADASAVTARRSLRPTAPRQEVPAYRRLPGTGQLTAPRFLTINADSFPCYFKCFSKRNFKSQDYRTCVKEREHLQDSRWALPACSRQWAGAWHNLPSQGTEREH